MKRVCGLGDVPPGCIHGSDLDVDTPLAIYNVNGEIFATSAHCPHEGGPLTGGMLDGHMVTCPWHQWTFDIRTGVGDYAGGLVDTYEVSVEGDDVLVGKRKPISIPVRTKGPRP